MIRLAFLCLLLAGCAHMDVPDQPLRVWVCSKMNCK